MSHQGLFLHKRVGSGHQTSLWWAIPSWLCWSTISTLNNEIVATMSWRCHHGMFKTNPTWLDTTLKTLNSHQTLFLYKRSGQETSLWWVIPSTHTGLWEWEDAEWRVEERADHSSPSTCLWAPGEKEDSHWWCCQGVYETKASQFPARKVVSWLDTDFV